MRAATVGNVKTRRHALLRISLHGQPARSTVYAFAGNHRTIAFPLPTYSLCRTCTTVVFRSVLSTEFLDLIKRIE